MAKRRKKEKVEFPRGKDAKRMADLRSTIDEQKEEFALASQEERSEMLDEYRDHVKDLRRVADSIKVHANSTFKEFSRKEVQEFAKLAERLLAEVESQPKILKNQANLSNQPVDKIDPGVPISQDIKESKEVELSAGQFRKKDEYESSIARLKNDSLGEVQMELEDVEAAISNPPTRRDAMFFCYNDVERDLLLEYRDQLRALLSDSGASSAEGASPEDGSVTDALAQESTSVQDAPDVSNKDLMNQTIDSLRGRFFWEDATQDEKIADIKELKIQIQKMEGLEGGDKSGHMYASLSDDEWSDMLRMKEELLEEFEASMAQSSPEPPAAQSPSAPAQAGSPAKAEEPAGSEPETPATPEAQPPQQPKTPEPMPNPDKPSPPSTDTSGVDAGAINPSDSPAASPEGKPIDIAAINPSGETAEAGESQGQEAAPEVAKSRTQRLKESAGNFWKKHFRGEVLPEEDTGEKKDLSKTEVAKAISYGLLSGAASIAGAKAIPDIFRYSFQRYYTRQERKRLLAEFDKLDFKPEAEAAAEVSNVHSRADEIKQLIEGSKHLTAAKKKEMSEKMVNIVSNYDGQIGLTLDRRNKRIAELINKTIETRIKGTTVIKETVNAAMAGSTLFGVGVGIHGIRSATYGATSLYERWHQVSKEREAGEREGGQLKEVFVNGFAETWSNLSGGKAETKLGKTANMAKAWGTVTRTVGFGALAVEFGPEGIDMILDKFAEVEGVDVEEVAPVVQSAEALEQTGSLAEQAGDASSEAIDTGFEVSQEILDIGKVRKGDGIVAIMQRQIENDPGKFGFEGDASDSSAVASWANKEAISMARTQGIISEEGEWRLTGKTIDKVSFVFKDKPDGGFELHAVDSVTGEDLPDESMDEHLYGKRYGEAIETKVAEAPVAAPKVSVSAEVVTPNVSTEGVGASEAVDVVSQATEVSTAAVESGAVEVAAEVVAPPVQEFRVPGFKGEFNFERGAGGQLEGINTQNMIAEFRARDNRQALDLVKDVRGPLGISDIGKGIYNTRKSIGQELYALIEIENALDETNQYEGTDEIRLVRKKIAGLIRDTNETHKGVMRIYKNDRRIVSALS